MEERISEAPVGGIRLRPNGPGDPSPGLRPKADALGSDIPPRTCSLKGRGRRCPPVPDSARGALPVEERDLATLQAAGLDVSPLPRASAFGRSPGLRSLGPLGRFRVFRLPLGSCGLLRRGTGFFTVRPRDFLGERAGLVTVRASARLRELLRRRAGLIFSEGGRLSREACRSRHPASLYGTSRASARRSRESLPESEPARSLRGLLRDLGSSCTAARASCGAARPCLRPHRGTWFEVRRTDEPVCLFFSKSPYLAEVLGTSPRSLETLSRRSRPGGKVRLLFLKSRDSGRSSRELGRSSRDFASSPENLPQISRPGEKAGLFFPKSRDRGGKSRDFVSSTKNLRQGKATRREVRLIFFKISRLWRKFSRTWLAQADRARKSACFFQVRENVAEVLGTWFQVPRTCLVEACRTIPSAGGVFRVDKPSPRQGATLMWAGVWAPAGGGRGTVRRRASVSPGVGLWVDRLRRAQPPPPRPSPAGAGEGTSARREMPRLGAPASCRHMKSIVGGTPAAPVPWRPDGPVR
jgi:hypothetical protein